MQQITVVAGERPYPVLVGAGLLDGSLPEPAAGELAGRRVFVVSDRTVWAVHGARLEAALGRWRVQAAGRVLLEPGEAHKDLDALSRCWDGLVAAGIERHDLLVAFGGGVVGDVAGFAAATYLRGVGFVQVPTTVLAAVDSSVGGKTAIDHPGGKNLVGAFHQPRAVVADLGLLHTLPRREVMSGLAEAIKAGVLGDPDLFRLLEARGPAVVADPAGLEQVVARAVAVKARVVAADEREAGRRAVLNLGHTLGHAVEAAAGYGAWTHGEAVAVGMAFAADLSERLGRCTASTRRRIVELLENWGYPLTPRGISAEKIFVALRHDKKSRGGAPLWVLVRDIGDVEWGVTVPEQFVAQRLREVQGDP